MKFSRSLKYFLIGFLVTTIAILSVSCDSGATKKSTVGTRGNTGTTTTGGTSGGCDGCSTSTFINSSLGESLTTSSDSFQLALDFYYVGNSNQVAAEGVFFVNHLAPVYSQFGLNCSFKAGNYTVTMDDIQYGIQSQSGSVSNIGLKAVDGNEVLRMRLAYANFNGQTNANLKSCDGHDYQSAMLGTVQIISVNGVSCGVGNYVKEIYPTGNKNFNCGAY